jgi:hypothetical protein
MPLPGTDACQAATTRNNVNPVQGVSDLKEVRLCHSHGHAMASARYEDAPAIMDG